MSVAKLRLPRIHQDLGKAGYSIEGTKFPLKTDNSLFYQVVFTKNIYLASCDISLVYVPIEAVPEDAIVIPSQAMYKLEAFLAIHGIHGIELSKGCYIPYNHLGHPMKIIN